MMTLMQRFALTVVLALSTGGTTALAGTEPEWTVENFTRDYEAEIALRRSTSASGCIRFVVIEHGNSPLLNKGRYTLDLYSQQQSVSVELADGRTREIDPLINPCLSYSGNPMWIDVKNRRLVIERMSNKDFVQEQLRKLKAFPRLEQWRSELMEKMERDQRAKYLATYQEARTPETSTLEKIAAFERAYAANDPDNLIGALAPLKARLEQEQYRRAFGAASSSAQLQDFVDRYKSNDPEGLVPVAQSKLTVALTADRMAALEQQQKDKEAQTLANIAKHRATIQRCRAMTSDAQEAILREKKIAEVSGYENKMALREAGEIIVECDEQISKSYTEYRRSGGKEPLAQIK